MNAQETRVLLDAAGTLAILSGVVSRLHDSLELVMQTVEEVAGLRLPPPSAPDGPSLLRLLPPG